MESITLDELLKRLDIETDCLGDVLRKKMADDKSPVAHIEVKYELLEGGEAEDGSDSLWNIKSFIIWTAKFVYHTVSDEDAFLYEDGMVFKVKRHP